MYAIEFQAQIRDGKIEIPAEEREALAAQVNGGTVRVIVMAPEKKQAAAATEKIDLVQDAKNKGYDSFIKYLLDHPLQIPDFRPLTRDEIYDRSNF